MDIRYEIEDISTVKKRLKVEIPADTATKEFERIASDYQKHARLPGFRPGRAPLGLVKRRFLGDIRDEVIRKLMPDSYEHVLRQTEVRPLGDPSVENLRFEEGQPLSYEALFEVRPKIQLGPYQGLEIRVEEKAASDEDVAQQLSRLQEEHAQLVPVEDRPAATGDFVTVDVNGEFLADEAGKPTPSPIHEEEVVVHLGDADTHESFNQALQGMNLAEEKSFEASYPDDYPGKKLAGHRLRFTVEVTDIKARQLPELDDDFASEVGEFKSLEELRTKVREELTELNKRNRDGEIKEQLITRLVEGTSFEVPDVLVDDRVNEKLKEIAQRFAYRGIDPSRANVDWRKLRAELRSGAERDVRGALILDEVASAEGLKVGDDEIHAEIARVAESTGQALEKVRQYFLRDENLAGLRVSLRRQKALGLIRESATVH